MLPLLVRVSIRRRLGPRFRVWLPLFLLWILLLPLLLVLSPIIAVVCLLARLNPFGAFLAIWRILEALKGTDVEVDWYSEAVTVHIV